MAITDEIITAVRAALEHELRVMNLCIFQRWFFPIMGKKSLEFAKLRKEKNQ